MAATLIVAHGREYRSAQEVIDAYQDGKDFLATDMSKGIVDQRCSCRDFVGVRVKLRYNKNSKSTFATHYKPR